MITRADITGLVLAGGMGRRMGGVDKGLQSFRGHPMIAWSLARYEPQVGAILVNANKNISAYEGFGYPVLLDTIEGYAGPLAGFHTGLGACKTPYLATIPCDSPFLPTDLVERLAGALGGSGADIAVARTGGEAQPVFTLMRTQVFEHLDDFLRRGGRKIDAWYAKLGHALVDFDDEAEAFVNLNSLDELRLAETGQKP